MKTYLSIDLDFWNTRKIKECRDFMKKVKDTGIPIKIVDDHADLLPFINHRKYDCIINIDYHSDISNNAYHTKGRRFPYTYFDEKHIKNHFVKIGNVFLPKLNCGTWANWINHKNSFIWIHPFDVDFDLALCHVPRKDKFSPFIHPEISGFGSVSRYNIHNSIPSWVFNNVKEIGIACSYKWLEDSSIDSHPLSLVNVINDVFEELPTNKEEFYFLIEPKDLSDEIVIEINSNKS